MFIIHETLNPEKIPQGKEEELFQQHVAWFTRHFEQGNFLLVGPYTDQEMAGIMLSGLENREALEAVLKEDVYYADGMADYEVHAFKEPLINSALRLHASALFSRRRQILSVARYASGLSPREIQRIRANPEHLI